MDERRNIPRGERIFSRLHVRFSILPLLDVVSSPLFFYRTTSKKFGHPLNIFYIYWPKILRNRRFFDRKCSQCKEILFLRLCPVLSAIPRRPKQDIILGGYHISGGTAQVEILVHQMERDVTIFEDAEAFKPKRWLQTKDTALIETVEAFASLQFGLRTPFNLIALLKCSLLTENESGFHVATVTLH